jgi:hypothetical protein
MICEAIVVTGWFSETLGFVTYGLCVYPGTARDTTIKYNYATPFTYTLLRVDNEELYELYPKPNIIRMIK